MLRGYLGHNHFCECFYIVCSVYFVDFNKFLLFSWFLPNLQSMLWEEKLWEQKWDSFRPRHHRQVGGESNWSDYSWFLSFMNLNTEYQSLGICHKVGFMSSRQSQSNIVFLFWLTFFGRSQNLLFWTRVSKSMMGFFSRCTDVNLIRSMWMVKDSCSPIWQSWVSVSFLEEAVYPKLSSNSFIILSDCCWVWRLSV